MVLKGRVGEIDFPVHPLPLFPAPTAFIVCLPFWNLVWKKKTKYKRQFSIIHTSLPRVPDWKGIKMEWEVDERRKARASILQQVK